MNIEHLVWRIRSTLQWMRSFSGLLLIGALTAWAVGFFWGHQQFLFPLSALLLALLIPHIAVSAQTVARRDLKTRAVSLTRLIEETGSELRQDMQSRLAEESRCLRRNVESTEHKLESKIRELQETVDFSNDELRKLMVSKTNAIGERNFKHLIQSTDGIRNDLVKVLRSDRSLWRTAVSTSDARLGQTESNLQALERSVHQLQATLQSEKDASQRDKLQLKAQVSSTIEDHLDLRAKDLQASVSKAVERLEDNEKARKAGSVEQNRRLAALATEISDCRENYRSLSDDIEAMAMKLHDARSEIAGVDDSLLSLNQLLTREREDDNDFIDQRLRATIKRFWSTAARSAIKSMPRKLLLIVAPHRTGSTWLLDQLRTHPLIAMHPGYEFYEALGMQGRRYPGALTVQSGRPSVPIEAQRNDGQLIPDNPCSIDVTHAVHSLGLASFAIEKVHPLFFGYDTKNLNDRISRLEEGGTQVKVIYLLREPEAAVRSFLRYQRRQPNWYKDLGTQAVMDLYVQSFKSIKYLAKIRPGRLYDYHDQLESAACLASTFSDLWGSEHEGLWLQVAEQAKRATNRDDRAPSSADFFGKKGEPETFPELEELLTEHAPKMEDCQRVYRELSRPVMVSVVR